MVVGTEGGGNISFLF